jgi:hypothetical protein
MVSDSPRTCGSRTARLEEVKTLIFQSVMQSPRKPIHWLVLEQGLSGQSVQQILCEARFKHYIPRLTHGLLEEDTDFGLHFCELILNELMNTLICFVK